MAVETHWICDVCGKRVIYSGHTKNVNETGIKDWYTVNLSVSSTQNPLSRDKHFFKYGYACSDDCLDKVVNWLKKLAKEKIKREESK